MEPHEPWTILRVLAWTRDYLVAKGIPTGRLEAEWLLCSVTHLDRVGLYLNFDKPLTADERATYRDMVVRRGKREPLQHILGSQEFCGLEFEVSPEVLIPRHDTEPLVSTALDAAPDARSVLDIGTGSGCVAVVLARRLPHAAVTATDISEAALAVARRNALRNETAIEFLCGSLLEPVAGRCFDLIVSNPPYIATHEIEGLEPEVRDFDPRMALDGGADGLDLYRLLVPAALNHLSPDGWLFLEIGAGQAGDVSALFRMAGGYAEPIRALDPGGIERVIGARRKERYP
jgi:release factor glutamine methyltransferase